MTTTAVQINDVSDCSQPATAPAEKRQECLLLIEDSEDAMLLVKYALREYGHGRYRLVWASKLIDGLEQLSRGGIDLVLLDLGLPESSGTASYAHIREVAAEVPVIVLTGNTSEETEVSLLASGAADYLSKTLVSGSLLLEAIRVALFGSRQRQSHKVTTNKFVQRFRWKLKS
jgi:DNA-binding response OmpR family regulator